METLSYLATFLSLILGLAVANVLSRLSAMFKAGRDTDWYYLHTLWAVFLLFLMALEWWVILLWGREGRIGFFVYIFLLAKPCVLSVASDMLFPETIAGRKQDLRAHFWAIRRRYFAVTALYPVLDVVDTLLKGVDHLRELGPIYPTVIILTLIGCYKGFNAAGGARGVGIATTQAVVIGSIAIFVSDYVLTTILLAGSPQ